MAELAEVVYQRELNYSKRLARNFARDPYWPSREGVDQPPGLSSSIVVIEANVRQRQARCQRNMALVSKSTD